MIKVNWFEIPVNDFEKAKKFYEELFSIELSVNQMGEDTMGFFPFEKNATGAMGAIVKAEGYVPSYEGTVVYFSVPEINDVLKGLEKAGGKLVNPKMSIGEHGFVAYFEDSEGNRVALHQEVEAKDSATV